MDGVSLEVRLQDFQPMMGAMKRVAALGDKTYPLMQDIGRYGENSTKLRFQDQKGPDGLAWKQSRRAKVEGGLTLVKSTQLLNSISSEATKTTATWGTNKIYARMMQNGGTISPVNAKALRFTLPGVGLIFAHHVTIPARPFIGINKDDQDNIADIIVSHYDRAVGK